MKYISVVILLILMVWTWSLASGERSFTLEQHRNVEAGVEEDIRAFIQKKYPEATEVFCHQLYTEVVKPGIEMIARFRCQATAPENTQGSAEQVFEGHLVLRSEDSFQSWNEVDGQIRSPEIRFLNGIKISPNDPDGSQNQNGESNADGGN